jgi:hypothetical protein
VTRVARTAELSIADRGPVARSYRKFLAKASITAFAVMLNAGFTVDLRFLDLPTGLVFLIVGVAIGCQQRHALQQCVPAVEPDDRMVVQHG